MPALYNRRNVHTLMHSADTDSNFVNVTSRLFVSLASSITCNAGGNHECLVSMLTQLVTGQGHYFAHRQVLFPVATTTPHRHSFDDDTIATLVHVFVVASRVTVSWPKKTADKLQRVLNAAARIVLNHALACIVRPVSHPVPATHSTLDQRF